MTGFDPENLSKELDIPMQYVVAQGGEYFFLPSITTLGKIATNAVWARSYDPPWTIVVPRMQILRGWFLKKNGLHITSNCTFVKSSWILTTFQFVPPQPKLWIWVVREIFDEFLTKYKDAECNGVAVHSWLELETSMGADLLSESVTQTIKLRWILYILCCVLITDRLT